MIRKKLRLSAEDSETSANNNITRTCSFQDDSTSKYFPVKVDISTEFLKLETDLNQALSHLQFPHPVKYVYNPIEYAFEAHAEFVKKFCKNEKKVMLLGMNPGPYGMCQTGIPFGEVKTVMEWFNINSGVTKPELECPKRPVLGFECKRSEISGKRLWNLFRNICGVPENFFRFAYMHNYCPLALMKEDGTNVTPADMKGTILKELEEICDATLAQILQLLKVEIVIGIGRYAEVKAKKIVSKHHLSATKVVFMPHPSPRSINNNNWPEKAEQLLGEIGVMQYFTTKNWLVN